MMSDEGVCEYFAVRKFRGTPELVEKLLPYLNLASIKQLAQFHRLTRNILKKAFVWNKLVKRTFPEDANLDADDYIFWMIPGRWQDDAALSSEKLETGLLAGILSLIQDSPGSHLELVLLHTIADKYLGLNHEAWTNFVEVSCSCQQTHPVAPWGFVLLEETQATLGFRKQYVLDVGRIKGRLESPLSTALSSLVTRQQGVVISLEVDLVVCSNKEDAEAIATLVEQSQTMTVEDRIEIEISEWTESFNWALEFGSEGWSAIRRAVEHMSNTFGGDVSLSSERKAMMTGEKEDLWDIERAISSWYIRSSGHGTRFEKKYGRMVRHDDEWGSGPNLETVVEMSEKDWLRMLRMYNEKDSDSEEDELEDQESERRRKSEEEEEEEEEEELNEEEHDEEMRTPGWQKPITSFFKVINLIHIILSSTIYQYHPHIV